MSSKAAILASVPLRNRSVMLVKDQDVPSIIKAITYYHQKHTAQYDKFASQFDVGNERAIAKALFNFCKKNIEYCVQDEEVQSIRTPARMLWEGNGDCKHYASFIAGVLDSLKRQGLDIDWAYRFAKYNDSWGRVSNHVFVVLYDHDGKEIWIDPVLNWFDYHLPYTSAITKSVDTQKVMGCISCAGGWSMSGCGCSSMGSVESDFQDALKQYELGLYDSYNNLLTKGQLSPGIDDIIKGALASGVPGAAQAMAIANTISAGISKALGPGNPLSRVSSALLSSNVLSAIPNAIKAAFGPRTFNSQSYYLYQDFSYHVLGIDAGSTDHVSDKQVPVAAMWMVLKLGIFMPGRNFLGALRSSVDDYLALISQNPRTTQDRVRVQLARDVMMNYMPNVLALKNWAGTVGVYDNAVTAAIEKARIADPNATLDTKGITPTYASTPPATATASTTGMNWGPLLLAGAGLYFLSTNNKR